MEVLMLTLQIMGSLGVFLFGLKIMSEGLQKAAGSKLRAILAKATDNRLVGTVSGFLVTCAVQSSSATTVMVVAFCSAGCSRSARVSASSSAPTSVRPQPRGSSAFWASR